MGKRVSRRVTIALTAGGTAAFFLGAVVLLVSCSTLRSIFKGNVEIPRVSIVSANIERLSFDEAELLFVTKVENPNRVWVKLVDFDYAIIVDETKFIEGVQISDENIGPRGENTVKLPLTVRYEVLLKAYANLADRQSTKYRLESGFRFDIPELGKTRVPLVSEGEIPVLRAPSLRLDAVSVSRLDFTEADLVLEFAVQNPNEITFNVDRFNFKFEVAGQSWASGGTSKKTGIGAGAETLVRVPVRVSTFFIGQTGYRQLLETRPLSYRVSGEAVFSAPLLPPGGIDFPFDASGIVEVTR